MCALGTVTDALQLNKHELFFLGSLYFFRNSFSDLFSIQKHLFCPPVDWWTLPWPVSLIWFEDPC